MTFPTAPISACSSTGHRVGRAHLLLIQDLEVRVVHAATGELPRELTIDPRRDYQRTGKPPGPTPKNK